MRGQEKTKDSSITENEHCKELYDYVPLGYQSLDRHGRIIQVNKAWLKMLGYSRKQVLGKDFFGFLSPSSRNVFRKQFPRFKKQGTVSNAELEVVRKDGKVLAALFNGRVEKDRKGRFRQTHCLMLDITEKKETEQALENRENLLKSIFRAAPAGIGLVRKRIFVMVNDKICSMTGYSEKELIGKSARILYPNKQEFERVGKDKYGQIKQNGIGAIETRWKRKDGKIIHVLLNSTSLNKKRLSEGVTFTAVDITRRHTAESQLKKEKEKAESYLDLAGVMMIAINEKGEITLINKKGCEILECCSEDAVGKNWFDMFIPKRSVSKVRQIFSGLMRGKIASSEYVENSIVTMKGKEKRIAWHNTVLKDDLKKIKGTLSSGEDITEKRKAQKKIEESEKRFRGIFEGVVEDIYISDTSGNFINVNKQACRTLGYTKEELLAMKVWDIDTIFNTRKKVIDVLQKLKNEKTARFESMHKRKDGSVFPVEISLSLTKLDSGEAVINTARNISKQKEAEQILKDSKAVIQNEVEKKTRELKRSQKEVMKLNKELNKHARKLDLKIKRIDERRVPLTDKEKLAFYGLVRYPGMTSKEIGKKLGMQTATVNSIKNRLKREGYLHTRYIPRFDMLGCSLLSFICIRGRIADSHKLNARKKIFSRINETPEKIYYLSTERNTFSISASQNWSSYKEIQDEFEAENQRNGIKYDMYDKINLPTEKLSFGKFFCFDSILKNQFKLNIRDSERKEPEYFRFKPSLAEKKIIYGLIKYPEYTVAQLAKTIGISVPTICKVRKKLLEKGILKLVNMPVFSKIGMELVVLTFNKHIISYKSPQKHYTDPFVFFSVSTKTENVTLSAYKNYTQAQLSIQMSDHFYKRRSSGNPSRIIIPLDSIIFRKLEFLPLIKKLFQLDVSF